MSAAWVYGAEQDIVWMVVFTAGWIGRSVVEAHNRDRLKAQVRAAEAERDLAQERLLEARDEVLFLRGARRVPAQHPSGQRPPTPPPSLRVVQPTSVSDRLS